MTAGPVVFNAKLRNRILVRILAAASLVLAVMGLVLYLLTRQLLYAEITAKSEAMVSVVAASMERWLVEKRAALAALAASKRSTRHHTPPSAPPLPWWATRLAIRPGSIWAMRAVPL